MPLMLPRQTMRKTSFGRPMRVNLCPIIRDLPLACARAMNVFSHGLGERAWPSRKSVKGDRAQRSASACQCSVFLRQSRRGRRQPIPYTPPGGQKQKNGNRKQSWACVWG
jgi:hypothetical protein